MPSYDKLYRRWFAWRPVILYGPDEWDRELRLNCWPRIVWLRVVWRLRTHPRWFYALPDLHSTDKLLLESMGMWKIMSLSAP